MNKILIILIFCLSLFSTSVLAVQNLTLENYKIDSFGGLIKEEGSIYVASSIRYNITLSNKDLEDLGERKFNVIIKDPSKDIIEDKTFVFDIKNETKFIILSNISEKDWKLIYASVPGTYQLILTSKSDLQLFELNPSLGYRYDYSLPIFFEVKSLQDKRIEDFNKKNIEIIEKQVEITGNQIWLSKVAIFIALGAVIISILELISKSEGRRFLIMKVLPYLLFLLVILWLIYFLILFLKY